MSNRNHKQEWLLSRLSNFNHDKEIVQAEIDATTDVLTVRKLEKRLDIIFGQIEEVEQEIQQEQKKCKDKLVQKKFDELIGILQPNESLWEKIHQAYQNTLLHWAVRVKQNVDDVQSIVAELNKISQGSLSYSALEEFIANLFNEIFDVGVSNALTQWEREYCQDRDWLRLYEQIQKSQERRLEKAQPAIVITITRSDEASTQSQDGETYYQLESWLIEDMETYQTKKTGFHSLLAAGSPDNAPCLLEDLLQNITHLLDRLISKQVKHCQGCENYPQIHVFLPLELMHLGVDVWSIDSGSNRSNYLGHDYLVFIHCANRYDGNYRKMPSWKKLWKRHQGLLLESAQNVFVEGHDNDLDDLMEILDDAVQSDRIVGLQVTDAPVDTENLVYELLDHGLPIAIWSRTNLAESAHRTQVKALLESCCLETLPSVVKEKRAETRRPRNKKELHIGHHLSFLWDDPHFYPPKSA
ncbi:hypothetical protein B9G53_21215 [Pseudanabaena sp. SR411]|uniref:VMAP-C domain-containing protein n=1 Tax=Pseudanabaena sp. SR411 TaxID=1980935 RepID=UPI000B99A664|nr:hypothetical protein [Pseudanabaena sp. SR411]OYQ62633.1 hypothetical protein B9G53_21215 [Pseudanabaena sp. SR411]